MGSGTKRAADDSTSTASPRRSKAQKTEESSDSKTVEKKAAKKSSQPTLSTAEFKSKALPLHVNLTHTPPSILKKVESDVAVTGGPESEDVDAAVVGDDIGFIENLTLLPSSFTTGSYGWKGSKRITVELQGGGGEGGKEKVQVMLSINATVIGSKPGGKKGKGNRYAEAKKPEEDSAEEPEADENDDER
ncbi:hypothetical protein BYT27DRAFT_7237857 [Phlegmacium glaucopus]|nr:hypothetical protein BYT27DRAFT_7237857 [Phlegmacium glaucopus]